jgi:hypothetical protein
MQLRPLLAPFYSLNRFVACATAAACLGAVLSLCAPRAVAQNPSDAPGEEIVANLAAGRVVIAVVKDAIVIGTLEDPVEPQTHPPIPVAIGSERAGVILGAVDWFSPSSQQQLARIDQELPHLHSHLFGEKPRLNQADPGGEAADIEEIGQGLFDRLNEVTRNLHSQIHLPGDEPVAELIIADYLPAYGPEVWQLTYSIKQEAVTLDFWHTHVLRPHYFQFWPPEKGQPHTLVEFHYPPNDASPSILDLLRKKDPRLERIRSSDAKMSEVADRFLAGDSSKILAADATQYLRAALDAIAPPKARETVATIGIEAGFKWVLAPPPEPKKPGQQNRPSGAPSLIKPSE